MPERQVGAAARPAAHHDRVVRQLVRDDGVVAAEDVRDQRGVREIAADHRQRALDADEVGELALQRAVQRALAPDQPRGAGPRAVLLQRVHLRPDDGLVPGVREVVVVGEAQILLP